MVGGGTLGYDRSDIRNPYGGLHAGFIHRKQSGSIFREAFENASKDVRYKKIVKDIKRVHLAAFTYYFMRCESDVLESFEDVKDVLELKELKWENCPVTCGSPQKLGDFIWSIHGNSLIECTKSMIEKDASIACQEKDDRSIEIINAVKEHLYILIKRDFPDGNTTVNYMYMVIKRKPRK